MYPPPPYYGLPPPAYYPPPPMPMLPRRYSPWLVPLIFLVNLGMFIWTMYENNCPSKLPKDECMLSTYLDRFSFQPWRDNRMIGPTPETLHRLGGLDTKLVVSGGESWRLFSSMWLHAGLIHLLVNMLSLDLLGLRLERDFGFHRFGFVYVLAGLGGSLGSCLNIVKQHKTSKTISVGASGATFGLLGASLSELITNWTVYDDKCSAIMILILNAALNLAIGFLLNMDNSGHVGGLIAGFFLGFVLFVKPQLGYVSSKYIPSYHQVKRIARHNFCQYFLGIVGLVASVILYAAAFGKLFNIKEIKDNLPDSLKNF